MFSRLKTPQVGRWSRLKNLFIPSSRKSSQAWVHSMTNSKSRINDWNEYYGGELPDDPFACYEPVTIIPKMPSCPVPRDTGRGRKPFVNHVDASPLLQRKASKPLPASPPVRRVKVKKRIKLHENRDDHDVSRTLKKPKPQGQSDLGYFQEQSQRKINYGHVSSRQAKLGEKEESNEFTVPLLNYRNSTKKERVLQREPSSLSTSSSSSVLSDDTFYTCFTSAGEGEMSTNMSQAEEDAMFLQARYAYFARMTARHRNHEHGRHGYQYAAEDQKQFTGVVNTQHLHPVERPTTRREFEVTLLPKYSSSRLPKWSYY